MTEFRIQLHELCKRNIQQSFIFFIKRLTESTIDHWGQTFGRSHCRLPPDRILYSPRRSIVIRIRVFHSRNKLVFQTDIQCRILLSDLLKLFRLMLQDVECQFERSDTMTAYTCRLEIICRISTEWQQFIISRTVQLIDIQPESCGCRKVKFHFAPTWEHHSGKSQWCGKSHLPTVHQRTFLSTSSLPLIRAFKLYIPAFSTTENVVTGNTKSSTGTGLIS